MELEIGLRKAYKFFFKLYPYPMKVKHRGKDTAPRYPRKAVQNKLPRIDIPLSDAMLIDSLYEAGGKFRRVVSAQMLREQ